MAFLTSEQAQQGRPDTIKIGEGGPLDPSSDPALDRLVRLARRLFEVPVAFVGLMGDGQPWFNASADLDAGKRALAASLCDRIVAHGAVRVVEDAAAAGFAERPPGDSEGAQMRFYAGAPLTTPSGRYLGAFGVLSEEPRRFSEDDRRDLRDFAAQATKHIEQRRTTDALRQSEERHRSLLRHLPVGVYRSTPRGRILEANQVLADLLGYDSPAALRRVRIQDLQVDAQEERRRLAPVFENENQQHRAGFALRRADGAVVHVHHFLRAVKDEAGRVVCYDGVMVDATEHERAQRRLEASESRLRAVVDNTADVIEIIDADGIIRYASQAVETLMGFEAGEVEGHSLFEYVHPEDEEAVRRRFEALLEQPGALAEHDYRLRHRDGGWRHVSARVRNALGRDGIGGLLGTVRDVTEKKAAEQELVEAKEEAEEVARLKSTFLANMSHEIRTPLASILGFAEVLAEEAQGEQREFAALIQQGGKRLSETLDSVLDLARLEADGFEPTFEAVSAEDVLQEAADLYAPMAENQGLVFQCSLPEERPLFLRADRAGVGRILSNLLSNAIKFTEEGTVTLTGRRAEEGRIELCVSDTGTGMGEEFQKHLFEAFQQESGGLSRLNEGTGLGLAITRHLADVMNADIRVGSTRGAGSTFLLSFPEWHEDTSARQTTPPSPSSPLSRVEAGRGRVLIVEDNRDTRRLLKRLLRAPWNPTIVAGPQEALAAAKEDDFDAILVDIRLGTDLDGVDLMKRLRQEDHSAGDYQGVPFIALTAHAMPGDKDLLTETGFDAYLSKPFAREELLHVLQQAIAGSRPAV